MAFQRLWSYQASGLPKNAFQQTQSAIQNVLDQLGEVGEMVGFSQTSAPDPKTAGNVVLTTFLVYRVQSVDAQFDFEG
jgi:hypothetical protein